MKELEFPFDGEYILKKKKSIKKELLARDIKYIEKKIAILGGSTTSDIKLILELFLLNQGIKPIFYESEYNQYWQDITFDNEELIDFKPDIIFIHTTNRNIMNYPSLNDSREEVDKKLEMEYQKFVDMWDHAITTHKCVIIQNNFEYPYYRLLGNKDATSIYGRTNFITKLNLKFAEYAESHENFYINDINYVSSLYGLDKWSNQFYWFMYKYAMDIAAIPSFAYNLSNIIKAIYGKNKKSFVLDLDNTLWGGIIGDDGVENIVLGQETAEGEAYQEVQEYLKLHKDLGIILNISSKNEEENALLGLNSKDSILKPEDFIVIKANWEPKNKSVNEIAKELELGEDSFVFVDDNPAERDIINQYNPTVSTPIINTADNTIKTLDRNAYFEVLKITKEDLKKNEMYKQNSLRNKFMSTFEDYGSYLKSLNMKATIENFIPIYMARIAQLTNKSNQFNLTTKRYSQSDIEQVSNDKNYITLYGNLEDNFGDNGVVSLIIGKKEKEKLHIDLWLMSCRVLKRDMEKAMLDMLVEKAKEANIKEIIGYYYPTQKNKMVKDFYKDQGFTKISEDDEGNTIWSLDLNKEYNNQNKYIEIRRK